MRNLHVTDKPRLRSQNPQRVKSKISPTSLNRNNTWTTAKRAGIPVAGAAFALSCTTSTILKEQVQKTKNVVGVQEIKVGDVSSKEIATGGLLLLTAVIITCIINLFRTKGGDWGHPGLTGLNILGPKKWDGVGYNPFPNEVKYPEFERIRIESVNSVPKKKRKERYRFGLDVRWNATLTPNDYVHKVPKSMVVLILSAMVAVGCALYLLPSNKNTDTKPAVTQIDAGVQKE